MATQSFLARMRSRKDHARKPQQPEPEPEPQSDTDSQHPIIDQDDEVFLNRIVSDSLPAAQAAEEPVILDEGVQREVTDTAQRTPLPPSPPPRTESAGKDTRAEKGESKWAPKRLLSMVKNKKNKKGLTKDSKQHKPGTSEEVARKDSESIEDESSQEDTDMAQVLDKLNLAAASDNRVFSLNKDMQTLLQKFKLILKDLLNGVPAAYNDLESLFKNREKQLQNLFDSLPSPLRKLIMQLPDKLTPEMLATAAEKAEKSGIDMENASKAASAAAKQLPKDWATKPAAILTFLRSIVAFLKARFPALLGVNVLWSLALTLLMLVLWYCHKRGREVRLENERAQTEYQDSQVDAQDSSAATDAEITSDPGPSSAVDRDTARPADGQPASPDSPAQVNDGGPATSKAA